MESPLRGRDEKEAGWGSMWTLTFKITGRKSPLLASTALLHPSEPSRKKIKKTLLQHRDTATRGETPIAIQNPWVSLIPNDFCMGLGLSLSPCTLHKRSRIPPELWGLPPTGTLGVGVRKTQSPVFSQALWGRGGHPSRQNYYPCL